MHLREAILRGCRPKPRLLKRANADLHVPVMNNVAQSLNVACRLVDEENQELST
jgi:hypothetical protein